jgi:phosphopantetheinyl transferase
MPGSSLVGLRDVRAYRWLAFDEHPQLVQVAARRVPGTPDLVSVQLRNLSEDRLSPDPLKSPVIEATAMFAASHPPPPDVSLGRLADGRPSTLTPDRLYTDVMFHGPLWRGVTAIEQTGDRGTVARLQVLPTDGFFRSTPSPTFVLDPIVLDAAGQVIGFWMMEHQSHGQVIFPFRLEALEVYGPPHPVGELITCVAAIQLVGEQNVRSDIEILDGHGHVWMRLLGWEDKRFDLPAHLRPLLGSSTQGEVSTAWAEPISAFPQPELFACRRVNGIVPSDQPFWKRVWAGRILSRTEREEFRHLRTPDGRQLEWLAGRTAAKEAVRHLLRVQRGIDVPLADIEITADPEGRPVVDCAWRDFVGTPLSVSVAHTGGWAVAVAGLSATPGSAMGDLPLGIDLERIRPREPGFVEIAFTADEQQLLADLADLGEMENAWTIRAWCAKEAIAKALGLGLIDGPRSVEVVGGSPANQVLAVELRGRLAGAFPDLAATPLLVYTSREGDLVVATTLSEAVVADPTSDTATHGWRIRRKAA